MPADGGWIEKDVRTRDRGKTRGLRIPLIPAHQHAQASETCIEVQEAEIAGGEIELLEVQRIVWDMHLTIDAFDLAVGVRQLPTGAAEIDDAGGERVGARARFDVADLVNVIF